jgi:sulfite reductase (NADPH) hemoprotein beta-component
MIDSAPEKKLSHNEVLKENDPILAGNLAETLNAPDADCFSNDDGQFLKFHGIYQQDDRDLRKTGKKIHVHDSWPYSQRDHESRSLQGL